MGEQWDVSRETQPLPAEPRSKIDEFARLVREQAHPLGLVGFPPERIDDEIARSLLLLPALGSPGTLVDVGPGAGFPGIPLAVMLGATVLIEPRRRPAAFLEKVVRRLGLDAEVVVDRAEAVSRGRLREAAEAVVARSLAQTARALEICAPLCAVGGRVVITAPPRAIGIPEIPPGLGLGNPRYLELGRGLAISQRVLIMDKLHPTSPELPQRTGHVPR